MDIETVFGVIWRQASIFEITIIFLFISTIAFFLILLKYNQVLKDRKIHDYQLFLFKLKRLGFSNFQIKIINNMVDVLQLKDPNDLLHNPELYEKAIGKFLLFLKLKNEQEESKTEICKDITITYEKLYHKSSFKKPLSELNNFEEDKLLYFTVNKSDAYLGKLLSKEEKYFTIKLFRDVKKLKDLDEKKEIQVHIWRLGDAEYSFGSTISMIDKNILKITIPEKFERSNEFRYPYIDVIITATIRKADLHASEDDEIIRGVIQKINDFEAIVKTIHQLDYKRKYSLEFEIKEFKFKVLCQVISDKTIIEEDLRYYTFKFEEITVPASKVLKSFIYEHL